MPGDESSLRRCNTCREIYGSVSCRAIRHLPCTSCVRSNKKRKAMQRCSAAQARRPCVEVTCLPSGAQQHCQCSQHNSRRGYNHHNRICEKWAEWPCAGCPRRQSAVPFEEEERQVMVYWALHIHRFNQVRPWLYMHETRSEVQQTRVAQANASAITQRQTVRA